MKTTPEQRAYSRGYHAGRKELASTQAETRKVMQGLVDRAQRAEANIGLGQCHQCRHWLRHEARTQWGRCRSNESSAGVKPYPWPWFAFDNDKPGLQPVPYTSQDFGCILFENIREQNS